MKPIEVGAFDAKNRLSELLAQAERGQRIMITRRGRRVAMLTAPDAAGDKPLRRSPQDIVVGLRRIRGGAKPGKESIKALIDEGRR